MVVFSIGKEMYPASEGTSHSTEIAPSNEENPDSYSALGGTAMTIRLIVWTGIRNLEIIISQFNPFNKCSASIPKYESVMIFLAVQAGDNTRNLILLD